MVLRGKGKTNYAYAAARVQAKRSQLIPESELEKLLKMDVSEITRYVQDSVYKAEVDELSGRFSGLDLLEAALSVNQERTNHAVRQMVDGEGGDLLNLFLMRHLKENIKAILRGKNAGASREELLKELLLEDLDTFNVFQPLVADDVTSAADVAAALLRQGGVAAEWGRVLEGLEGGLSAYEDALDKAYFGKLITQLGEAKQKGADLMEDFLRREIDAQNLQNAARWVGETGDFTPYIIPGGKLLRTKDIVELAGSDDLGGFADKLAERGLEDGLVAGMRAAADSGRLAPFQTAVWAWHRADLRKLAHQAPLSIVPILLFLVKKDREVRTLRTLARGRAAGLPEDRLKDMVMAA